MSESARARASALPLVFIDPAGPLYEAELDLRYRVLRAPLGLARSTLPLPGEDRCLHLVALGPPDGVDEGGRRRPWRTDERGDLRGDGRPAAPLDAAPPAALGCVLFRPDDDAARPARAATASGEPDGGPSGRLPSAGRLLQMAVDPAWQGTGLGQRLVRHLEIALARRGVDEVRLHARESALGFYARLGYEVEGEPFVEVALPHRHMRRRLSGGSSA